MRALFCYPRSAEEQVAQHKRLEAVHPVRKFLSAKIMMSVLFIQPLALELFHAHVRRLPMTVTPAPESHSRLHGQLSPEGRMQNKGSLSGIIYFTLNLGNSAFNCRMGWALRGRGGEPAPAGRRGPPAGAL